MRAKRFTAVFFLSMLAWFMCMVFAGMAMRAAEKVTAASNEVNEVNIDWEKLYPFEESADYRPEPKESMFAYIKEKLEQYTSEKIAGRFTIIKAAKTYEEFICWNMASIQGYNPVIKLHDGYLSNLVESRDISENAQAVKELDNFCRELSIECSYINLPTKICPSEDQDISGIIDYANQNTDRFLEAIGRSGVKYYDLRRILHEDGMNHHEAFFRTDHHWKPETGLWAAKHILEFLRDDYGWKVDPEILNPDKFERKVYPEWFLGSHGKKVTHIRTKPDDITLLTPKYPTFLHIEIPNKKVNLSGDFSVTYDMNKIKKRDYYNLSSFGAYNHGRNPLCIIENLIAGNNRKFMLIYDSFSDAVIPFLALGISKVYAVDLRSFTGSLKTCIKTFKPDALAVIYYSEFPGTTSIYDKQLYDFR